MASEVKHTPGPWFVGGVRQKIDRQETLGIFRYDGTEKRDENIASVWYDPRSGAGTNDARLIAAAPELLEALKECADSAGFQYMTFEARRRVEAALAKAEGK